MQPMGPVPVINQMLLSLFVIFSGINVVTSASESSVNICSDPVWCKIPMPKESYFRFAPPTDNERWKKAQLQAANGEQVLLKHISKKIPHYMDYLDGDIWFRQYHKIIDVFIDDKVRDLSQISRDPKPIPTPTDSQLYEWQKSGQHLNVLPTPYNFADNKRAPIVKVAYFAFDKSSSQPFDGPQVGEGFLGREGLLAMWRKHKRTIDNPFILVHSSNENWGLLSTYVPNRTVDWGSCCSPSEYEELLDLLNSDKLLMMVVNQHFNVSHPKLIAFPRGMPLMNENQKLHIWDTQRKLLKANRKENLVFTATSSWGPRPRIMQCIAKKFSADDFFGHSQGRISAKEYLRRLGSARFGLALAGLGYDTFR
jgi:hypothetical protein